MLMVAEWGRLWRPRRGGCVRPVQVTRTVLPSRCRTAVRRDLPPLPVLPVEFALGGDELRVRAWLRAQIDGVA